MRSWSRVPKSLSRICLTRGAGSGRYTMRKWAIGLFLLMSACFLPRAQTTSSLVRTGVGPPDFMLADKQDSSGTPRGRYLGRFKVTYYWAVEEAEYPTSRS